MSMLRAAVLSTGILLLVGNAMADTPSQAGKEVIKVAVNKVAVNIEAQPLAAALNKWAEQTGLMVMVPTEGQAETVIAPAVVGDFTAEEALTKLLGKTGFTYQFVNPRTVAIHSGKEASSSGLGKTIGASSVSEGAGIRLAQAEGTTEGNATEGEQQATSRSAEEKEEGVQLEEVVVTGTHIRGERNNTAPVIVLDRKYIEATGLTTTTRLIESLPQNFALANQSQSNALGVTGAQFQGSAINLRGIGEGTTLVLINGRRLAPSFSAAVNISSLPLSAIERVEVLTDGASAIYGSDAVGGVVNFILRDDFDGAETRVLNGWADGLTEFRASQAVGKSWKTGNALVSLEYYDRDLLRADERDFVPDTAHVGSLLPQDTNYSAMLSARQELAPTVAFFADFLHTDRESYNEADDIELLETKVNIDSTQTFAAAGVEWAIGTDWGLELSGAYARSKDKSDVITVFGPFLFQGNFDTTSARLKADGTLFKIAGGQVRAAIGGDWRNEEYEPEDSIAGATRFDQTVKSLFAEAIVPLFGASNAHKGLQSLELSVAARYDDYSSFGSSLDPRFGLMWEPVRGLKLRASYGTSFVAPKLSDYDERFNSGFAAFLPDPSLPGAGNSYMLSYQGVSAEDLEAQSSRNWSVGLEFVPASVSNLRFAVNYFDIEFSDRIAIPAGGNEFTILGNPDSFAAVFIRDPSVAQVDAVIASLANRVTIFDENFNIIPLEDFDRSLVDVIVDGRLRNLSRVDTRGVDFAVDYGFDLGRGRLQFALTATHLLNQDQMVTSTSPSFDSAGRLFHPADLRMRASLGWSQNGWSSNLFVNYTDSYIDDRLPAEPANVSSHETVDATLAYDFDARYNSGWLSGLTLSLSAMNLFNSDPPPVAVIDLVRDLGFDPANASPLGRLISIGITKVW